MSNPIFNCQALILRKILSRNKKLKPKKLKKFKITQNDT